MPTGAQTGALTAIAFAAGLGAHVVLPNGAQAPPLGVTCPDGGDCGQVPSSLVWPEVGRPCDGPDADDTPGGIWVESTAIGPQGQSAPICTEAVSATHTGTRP